MRAKAAQAKRDEERLADIYKKVSWSRVKPIQDGFCKERKFSAYMRVSSYI